MLDGLIEQLSHAMKNRPQIIVTGGYVQVMKKFPEKKINRIDSHLVLKGIYLVCK